MTQDEGALSRARKKLAEIIAVNMPPEIIDNAFREVAEHAIAKFSVEEYEVRRLLKEVVDARVKELLVTEYRDRIDKIAHEVALKAFSFMTK